MAASNAFATCAVNESLYCVNTGDHIYTQCHPTGTPLVAGGIYAFADSEGNCPATRTTCTGDQCGQLPNLSKTFDFNIQSGGLNQSLWVCEVGFDAHTCTDCNVNDDYMILHGDAGVEGVKLSYPNKMTFQEAGPHPTSAQVFLNSMNYGSGWYVRYCYGIARAIAGTDVVSGLLVTVNGSLNIASGNDNGYIAESKLETSVISNCSGDGTAFDIGHIGNDDGGASGPNSPGMVWDEINNETLTTSNTVCLDGSTNCNFKVCNWRVAFHEMAGCIRTIKNFTPPTCVTSTTNGVYNPYCPQFSTPGTNSVNCTGAGCELWAADVHTSLTVSTQMSCATCTP